MIDELFPNGIEKFVFVFAMEISWHLMNEAFYVII